MNLQELLKCPVADVDHDSFSGAQDYHTLLLPDAVTASEVADALPLLVGKVSAAVRMGLPRAAALFTSIIHAACCSSPEEVAFKLASERSSSGKGSGSGGGPQRVLQQLVDISSWLVQSTDLCGDSGSASGAVVPPSTTAEGTTLRQSLEILQLLASEVPVKDDLGDATMPLLMSVLQQIVITAGPPRGDDAYQRKNSLRNYELHRIVASTLINLFRGSKKNKQLALPYANSIASVMSVSLDYYLQMQCGEMLFRLYTFNRDALESSLVGPTARAAASSAGGTTSIPAHIMEGLRGVKNTPEQLLGGIESMLQRVHAHQQQNNTVDVRRAGVRDGSSSGGAGKAEDPLLKLDAIHVDVMSDSPVENAPRSSAASAAGTTTSSLCGPTVLHFNPLFLVFLIPHAIGTQVTVAYEDIRSVRISKDHKISLRLKNTPPYVADRLSEVRGGASALSAHQGGRDDGLDVLQLSVTTSTIEALKHSPVMQWISEAKKSALGSAASSGAATTHGGQPLQEMRSASSHQHEKKGQSSSVPQAEAPPHPTEKRPPAHKRPRSASAAATTAAAESRGRQSAASAHEGADGEHFTAMVERELRSTIASRIDLRSERNQAILSTLLRDVQEAVNEYRSDVSEWRDELEVAERASLMELKQKASEFKQYVRSSIREMNEELDDLKRLMDVVKANLDASVEGAKSLRVETKAAEKSMLVELKDVIDTQLNLLSDEMTAFVEKSNASLLGRVMSSKAAVLGARGGSAAAAGGGNRK